MGARFVYLYKLPVVKIEHQTLATVIKRSKGRVEKTYEVELKWRGYEEARMFHVAHVSGWDMILRKPGLLYVRATISAGTAPVTIQPPGMNRFSLRIWRGHRVTDEESHLSTAANFILAHAGELASSAAELQNQFNPVAEFAALFPKEIHRESPPLRKINHKITIIPESSCIPTYRPSGDR